MHDTFLRQVVALVVVVVLLSASVSRNVYAQNTSGTIDIYAITNARIVTGSGAIIERGTIVIRDGLIVAVGATVVAPADARVIDGTGLTVYPGLIDANSNVGMPAPAPTPARGARATPTTELTPAISSRNSMQPVGLQPEILAVDFLKPGGDQIENARNAGITSALTVPREGILIGHSALINLAGDTPQEMVVRSPVALHVGFTPLRGGGYPGSLMGVFSALRQMLLDAGRLRDANQIYDRNPRGLRRPVQDKSLIALLPALAREMPVVMYADTEREIRRALDLAQEFNLRVIIAGGLDSWKVTDRLRENNVPVLLSLNFPKRTTADLPDADPETLRILRQRVEAPKTAGRLAAAQVRFAFHTGGMTNMSEFLANAVKAIENGLPHDEALKAMTVRPAEFFGVADRLGTIEVGKIANLTLMRGDIFDKSARIAYVFIDGRQMDIKPATQSAASASATASVTGTWTIKIRGEGSREETAILTLKQDGTVITGSLRGDFAAVQISGGSIDGAGNFRFNAPVTFGEKTTEATFSGKLNGNEIQGSVQTADRPSAAFVGTKPQETGDRSQESGARSEGVRNPDTYVLRSVSCVLCPEF